MIFEGRVRRSIAEGPIMPAGDQLGIRVGEVVKQFKTFDQLLLPFEGKIVRIIIEAEPEGPSCQEVLRDVRQALETPELENIVEWAKKVRKNAQLEGSDQSSA